MTGRDEEVLGVWKVRREDKRSLEERIERLMREPNFANRYISIYPLPAVDETTFLPIPGSVVLVGCWKS